MEREGGGDPKYLAQYHIHVLEHTRDLLFGYGCGFDVVVSVDLDCTECRQRVNFFRCRCLWADVCFLCLFGFCVLLELTLTKTGTLANWKTSLEKHVASDL